MYENMRTCFCCFAALTLLGAHRHAPAQEASADRPSDRPEPAVVVEHLVSLQHGLARLGDSERALLADLKSHPDRYVDAVAEVLSLPADDDELAGLQTLLRLERGLGLAEALGPEQGQEMVRQLFLETGERFDPTQDRVDPAVVLPQASRNSLSLRRHALDVLGKFGDDWAIEALMASVEKEDLATRTVMLRYLGNVGVGNDAVRRELGRMVSDEESPLFRYPQAVKVLEMISAEENS